jgi:hypothetical protein
VAQGGAAGLPHQPARFSVAMKGGVRAAARANMDELDDRSKMLASPWTRPKLEKARTFRERLLFEKGAAPLCTGKPDQMDAFGVGIGLHFRLMRYLAAFFLAAAAISIPLLLIAGNGTRLLAEEMDPVRLSKVSIGNVGSRTGSFSNYTLTLPITGTSFSARAISNIFAGVDIAYSLLFIALILFVARRIRSVSAHIEASSVSVDDFAVFVQGLPPDVSEEEVRQESVRRRGHASEIPRLREFMRLGLCLGAESASLGSDGRCCSPARLCRICVRWGAMGAAAPQQGCAESACDGLLSHALPAHRFPSLSVSRFLSMRPRRCAHTSTACTTCASPTGRSPAAVAAASAAARWCGGASSATWARRRRAKYSSSSRRRRR